VQAHERYAWSGTSAHQHRAADGVQLKRAAHGTAAKCSKPHRPTVTSTDQQRFLICIDDRYQPPSGFSRDTGPFDRSATVPRPTVPMPPPYRAFGDPQIPGAISPIVSPRANRSALAPPLLGGRVPGPGARTACPGHKPATTRRHVSSTSSSWLAALRGHLTTGLQIIRLGAARTAMHTGHGKRQNDSSIRRIRYVVRANDL
jgi:hypothetical protein